MESYVEAERSEAAEIEVEAEIIPLRAAII